MEINFLKFETPDEIRLGAHFAIRSRLYVAGWEMRSYLEYYTKCDDRHLDPIVIAMVNNKPIACVMIYGGVYCVFVRKAYRRKGVGTAMVKQLMGERRLTCYTGEAGIKGSGRFYESMGITYEGSPRFY